MRGARQVRLQAGVEEALSAIVQSVNDYKDHIPPVTSSHTLTFPFDINISGWVPTAISVDAHTLLVVCMCCAHSYPPSLHISCWQASASMSSAESSLPCRTFTRCLAMIEGVHFSHV